MAPPGGEKTLDQVTGGDFGEDPAELRPGVVGRPGADVAELVGLLLDGGNDLGMLMAGVDIEELGGESRDTVSRCHPRGRPPRLSRR